jgi:hypothetical protein
MNTRTIQEREHQIDELVTAVMNRANQLAPNSNFLIQGFDAVKFRNVAQAIIEVLTDKHAEHRPTAQGAGDQSAAQTGGSNG